MAIDEDTVCLKFLDFLFGRLSERQLDIFQPSISLSLFSITSPPPTALLLIKSLRLLPLLILIPTQFLSTPCFHEQQHASPTNSKSD